MKVPLITSLQIEDVPKDDQSWMGKILSPINTFIGAVAPALTNRLTFGDNLLGQEQLLDFVWNGTNLPILFKISMASTPAALAVVSATENLSTPVAIIVAWGVNQQGQVQITDITKLKSGAAMSLTSGARYQIKVRITP